MTEEDIQVLWGSQECQWHSISVVGVSRGILMVWDNSKLEKIESVEGKFSLSIKVRKKETDIEWYKQMCIVQLTIEKNFSGKNCPQLENYGLHLGV